ncbi:MAG TPA: alpha/beta hydrolase [Polyangiaceae bacterium]|jgi:alpha-beta hydrolase superfamily lysophospholipase
MIARDEALVRAHTAGPPLYKYSVFPDQKPAAIVGLLHGYGEYAGRYAHVMRAWAERGIASVAIDLRGHGRSGGQRGYCARFAEYLDDARELEGLVAGHEGPSFLFGHSFGGLVAASSIIAKPGPWRALALSAPFLGFAVEVPPLKRIAGLVASRVLPRLSLPTGIGGDQVTHDKEKARAYETDPLVFRVANARWFTEVHTAQDQAVANARVVTLPLCVVMGGADPVARIDRARAFFDAAGAADKVWDERPGLLHEVLNEPEWPGIAARFADFILSHR